VKSDLADGKGHVSQRVTSRMAVETRLDGLQNPKHLMKTFTTRYA
jgi:hypothetical protein